MRARTFVPNGEATEGADAAEAARSALPARELGVGRVVKGRPLLAVGRVEWLLVLFAVATIVIEIVVVVVIAEIVAATAHFGRVRFRVWSALRRRFFGPRASARSAIFSGQIGSGAAREAGGALVPSALPLQAIVIQKPLALRYPALGRPGLSTPPPTPRP